MKPNATGADLVEARIELGLTQVELAENLGGSERTISRWEKYETLLPKWLRIAVTGIQQAQIVAYK